MGNSTNRYRAAATALAAFAILSGLGTPAAKAVDPPVPVSASETRGHVVELPASVDSLSGSTSAIGWRGWQGNIYNLSSATAIPSPEVQLDGVAPSWSFTPPPGPFPLTASRASLDPNTGFGVDQLGGYEGSNFSRVSGVSMTTGYDLSRSVSVTSNPDGSSTAHIAVTLTPTDPEWQGQWFALSVSPGGGLSGVDATSVTFPDLNGGVFGEVAYSEVLPNYVDWQLSDAVLGHHYTLTLDIDIPAGSGDTSGYRPFVTAYGSIPGPLPSSTGPSTEIHDGELGGTFTFSAGTVVEWHPDTYDYYRVDLAPREPLQATAGASVIRERTVDRRSTVDAIDGTHNMVGRLGWSLSLGNRGELTIPGAQMTIDGSTQTFTPTLTFPLTSGPPTDLAPGQGLAIEEFGPIVGSAVNGVTVKTGLDLSRSVSSTVPAGTGGRVTVTVDITPRGPADAGGTAWVDVFPADSVPGAAYVDGSLTSPDTSNGETLAAYPTPTAVSVAIGNVVIGKTYEVTLQIDVPNPFAVALVYRPHVEASVGHSVDLGPAVTGTSTTIADSVLGGTFTFSAATDVKWQRWFWDDARESLAARADAAVPSLDHFTVTPSRTTVGTGAPLTLKIKALDGVNHVVAGYTGPVTLDDSAHSLVVTTPATWSHGVGTATVTLSGPLTGDTITATDAAGPTGTSGPVDVVGPVTHFAVHAAATSVGAGSPLGVTVKALDGLNRVVTGYSGPVGFTDDSGPVTPLSESWANGVDTASLSLSTPAKADRVTVTDGAASGQSGAFNVLGAVTHFKVTASPASILVNTQQLTVKTTALDAADNTIVAYAGPVTYADANGSSAVHVVSQSWTNGVGTAKVTIGMAKVGDTVKVADVASPGIFGISNAFAVR